MPLEKDAIVNESRAETSRIGNTYISYDPNIFTKADSELFSSDYWQAQDAIVGQAKGRGITWFFQHQDGQYVLRHYYRGGMIGKLVNDHYLYFGYKKSRAYREFSLLQTLYNKGLPVPYPAACLTRKAYRIYCVNDIITQRIENAQSLVERLIKAPLPQELWQNIGNTIRTFHDEQVYHHDLNAHNILLDSNDKVWLIDFDQGEIRRDTNNWKAENIERFKRSLNKEQGKQPSFFWSPEDWQMFSSSYSHEKG